MKATRKVRAITIAITSILISSTTIGAAHAKVAAGSYEFNWEVTRTSATGSLSDSIALQYSDLETEFTYDVGALNAQDSVKFVLRVKRNSDVNPLPTNKVLSSVNKLYVDGKKIDLLTVNDSDIHVIANTNEHLLKVKMSAFPDAFDSNAALNGTYGAITLIPTVIVTHKVQDPNNSNAVTTTTDPAVDLTPSTSGVTGLKYWFTFSHSGASITLPSDVETVVGDGSWKASSTIKKNATVKANVMKTTMKLPHSTKVSTVAFTACTDANKSCANNPATANEGYFTLVAAKSDYSAYESGSKTHSVKLNWSTNIVLVDQIIYIPTTKPAGTVLTMWPFAVTK